MQPNHTLRLIVGLSADQYAAEMPGLDRQLFDRTPVLLETMETAPDLIRLDAESATWPLAYKPRSGY